jgi:hypothetical protein
MAMKGNKVQSVKNIAQNNMNDSSGEIHDSGNGHLFDDVLDMRELKSKPVNIYRLCKELISWSLKSDSWRVGDFCTGKWLRERELYRLAQKYEQIHNSLDFAKQVIGCRRERAALERTLDAGVILKSIGHYSIIHREEQERLARLRDEESNNKPTAINIVMSKVKETDEIKPIDTAK